MKNVFKKVLVAGSITLMVLCFASILIWQYLEYKRELNYYEIQERWHQSIYVNDKYEIKSKTISDISDLIEDTKQDIDRISKTLPEEGYYSLYKIIVNLQSICNSNKCHLVILGIETEYRDFYEKLKINCSIEGERKDIIKSLEALRTDSLLIRWENACFQTASGINKYKLSIRFSSFLFIASKSPRFRSNGTQSDPLEYSEVRTWLPPLSIWIKRYQTKTMAYKKIQDETPEFKIKVEMIKHLIDVRKKQRIMSSVIDSLQEVASGSDQILTNISSCH
jgi:hypothetical protein